MCARRMCKRSIIISVIGQREICGIRNNYLFLSRLIQELLPRDLTHSVVSSLISMLFLDSSLLNLDLITILRGQLALTILSIDLHL